MTMSTRIHFSKEDIGAEILPILTLGLYRDTFDALREYIQNSIDADSTQIDISINPDIVSISDNGFGMTNAQARRALRLGISDKNPRHNIGFRGIGIYSAFNLCDSLEIYTQSSDDPQAYKLVFDFAKIRQQLLAEQERRSNGQSPQLYLERLLEQSVFMDLAPAGLINGHGTKVVMSGLLSEAYRPLNDWDTVVNYLQNVVPLPFNPGFKFREVIQAKFDQQDYRVVPLTLRIGSRTAEIYRPYTDAIFKNGGLYDPEFFDIKDKGIAFGFAWVCVNDARETIDDARIRGLLIKKFGFSISDRRFLEPYFGRTVYSRRITGEIIIRHDGLVPNAARSDFENNSVRQAFLETLPKFIREVDSWANNIQEQDRAREVLTDVTVRLAPINMSLPGLQRDRERLVLLNAELAELERRLKPHIKRLKIIEPERLKDVQELLTGAQAFVRESLVSQRRASKKVEEEVVKAVQREQLASKATQEARSEVTLPDLVGLLESYGLLDSASLHRTIQYLDEHFLKKQFDANSYSGMIVELQERIEEGI